ncbi:hypothetical protein DW1_1023 [Proteiniborus sp. DW1]|uniref:Eco57I restriction-modification methylase domain-containing protein n=1 Tax=Proteiniborus sp. DW1 TaxID=1889883 RepID=UPI00092DF7FB|nr:TaqI-like C-terminal specificity domain-containing protein [Proteiniborus sp. DW1]SCG82622.1 hypothetical protein DW1_1023 [Proteiniborus sp. DW1]
MKPLIAKIENIYESYSTEGYREIDEEIIHSVTFLILKYHGIQEEQITELGLDKLLKVKNYRAYSQLECSDLKQFWRNYMILAKVYEYIVSRKIDRREKYGIYYTPEWIVKHMVDKSVNEVLKKRNRLKDIRILEPACGCGVFLLYLFDALYELYLKRTKYCSIDICKNIIRDNLYGVDIDPNAIEICKYLLLIKVLIKTGKAMKLEFNLFDDDFLVSSSINGEGYDLIIGNPPYLENRGLNKYFDKEFLKRNFATAIGRFDIYSLFIEKSISLLNKDGSLNFVVPGNLLYNNNFAPIRRFILDNSSIISITNLGEGIFQDVGMNMIIISLYNSIIKSDNLIKCKNISNSEDKKRDIEKNKYKEVPQRFYENTLLNVFDIESSYETFELREKIYQRCNLRINDVAEVVSGIATGNIRANLLTKDGNKENTKRVLEGKNVKRFYHEWAGLYFINDKSIIDRNKGQYATFMREDMINKEKLIIRQTADKFICSYDNEKYYILNTLYSLVIRESYKNTLDIKYLLALLNSKLYNFLYSTLIREKGKLFPQLKVFHIQYSPIVIPDKNTQQKIRNIVDKIIILNKKINNSDTKDSTAQSRHEKERESLYHLLDKMIYKIFGLNFKEIETINKEVD